MAKKRFDILRKPYMMLKNSGALLAGPVFHADGKLKVSEIELPLDGNTDEELKKPELRL